MDQPSDIYLGSTDVFEHQYVRPKTGRTLIVGSRVYNGREDRRARYENAVGWDMLPGEGVDRVVDLEQSPPADAGKFSHAECISVLEHSKAPWLIAKNIESLMEPDATLHLQVPFVWRVHAYPDDYWRFTVSAVKVLFPNIRWSALAYAGSELRDKTKSITFDGCPYFERTQVVGFGKLIGG